MCAKAHGLELNMKNKTNKICAILLAFTFLCIIPMNVNASSNTQKLTKDNIGVSYQLPKNGEISTYGTGMPSEDDIYSNGSDNSVSGSANNQELYTNYCFYGVKSISYAIKNNYSSDIKIKLRRYNDIGQQLVETKTISKKTTQYSTFSNLNSGYYYFIEFCAPTDFSGTVKGNS